MQQKQSSTLKINWQIINALRGIAALYVVLNHSRGMLFTDTADYVAHVNPQSNWSWWEWTHVLVMQHVNLSTESVILFFILSGFSIAHSVSGNTSYLSFLKRRFIRLYPTYVLGMLLAILAFHVIRLLAPEIYYHATAFEPALQEHYLAYIDPVTIINNLLYNPTHNYITTQYWSLPLEVIFYLIAPFFLVRFRWYTAFTVGLYAIGWAMKGAVCYNIFHDPIPLQFFIDFGIYFWVGVLMYKHKDKLLNSFKLNKWVMFALILLLFEVAVITKSYLFGQLHNKYMGFMMIAICYLLLFGFLKNNIRIKWLERIGAYSYTLYVSHSAALYIVGAVAYYYGLGFFEIRIMYYWYVGIAASILLAYLTYWVAEYPSTKYLEKLRAKRKEQDSTNRKDVFNQT